MKIFHTFYRLMCWLLGKSSLLQQAIDTLDKEGIGLFILKTKRYFGSTLFSLKYLTINRWKANRFFAGVEPHQVYIRNNEIRRHIRNLLENVASRFEYRPLISVIMPTYNTDPRWMNEAVASIQNQIYENWELCIADDGSTRQETISILHKYAKCERIKVIFRSENGGICKASNSAVELAQGDFLVLMDHDDVMAPNALFEVVLRLQDSPDADLIYSDEDKIDDKGKCYDPQFKPDWSPELLLSYNYINHLTCIRRDMFESVGGFRPGFEGAQDYDLLLRIAEQTKRVEHIPKVLYHWRAIRGSVAMDAKHKPMMVESAHKALEDHLRRVDLPTTLYTPDFALKGGLPISLLDWPDSGPSVAVIVTTGNRYLFLKKCVESTIRLTTYQNYEIVVVDNESDEQKTLDYIQVLADKGIRILQIKKENNFFNYSRINNLAVEKVDAEYILFLNNDTEIREPKWLSRLVGYLGIPGVGVVGARLLRPDKTIQHAGMVLGMKGGIIPDHAFSKHPTNRSSYYFMAEVARNCSAVSGACLMTRRSVFLKLGGFDERRLSNALQDVDYCLRLANEGFRTVYVPGAELLRHESTLCSQEEDPRELGFFRKKHGGNRDPFYNPNLSQYQSFVPALGCASTDYIKFRSEPLKVMMFTHDLALKGAQRVMFDLAVGLKEVSGGKIVSKAVSPISGHFRALYKSQGIQCHILDQNIENVCAGWLSRRAYEQTINKLESFLQIEKPDVVISNTVFGFYVIHAARNQGIPAIWNILESLSLCELRNAISSVAWRDCEQAFADACYVVFGSHATRRAYEPLNFFNNFHTIHYSADRSSIDRFKEKISKEKARQYHDIPSSKKVLLNVGTICERKGQETIVEAAIRLRALRNDFCFYLVGAQSGSDDMYLKSIYKKIEEYELSEFVKIIPVTADVFDYYRLADIFVFTSHRECYPLTVLEAMGFGLPVVTTLCYGVKEQILNMNALFFCPSDSIDLANKLSLLLENESLVKQMGRNSRFLFEYHQNHEEMVQKYMNAICGAWLRGR